MRSRITRGRNSRASGRSSEQLIDEAFLVSLSSAAASARDLFVDEPDLGFIAGDDEPDLHPLLRDFLLDKLKDRPDARAQIHEAIDYCLEGEHWADALGLVSRFSCDDLIEPALQRSFKPLVRNGRIGTLSSLAAEIRLRPTFPAPSVDVVEAEVALRDGNLELSADLATRAGFNLATDHPLRSRASLILGHSRLEQARSPKQKPHLQTPVQLRTMDATKPTRCTGWRWLK